jgi:hypothetical protein
MDIVKPAGAVFNIPICKVGTHQRRYLSFASQRN